MTNRFKIACLCMLAAVTATSLLAQENAYVKKNRDDFEKVVKHLDREGNFLLYVNVEDVTKGIGNFIGKLETTVMPMVTDQADPNVSQGVAAAFRGIGELYKSSGLPGIGGFGISSLRIDETLYRSKGFLYMDPNQPAGTIRKVMGDKAHELDCIDLLPKETAMAIFCDVDMDVLWKWHYQIVESTQHPQLKELHRMGLAQLKRTVDLDKLLASTDKTMGILLTLDAAQPVTFPIRGGQATMKIPAPGLAVFLKTKDDSLKNYAFGKLVMNGEQGKQPIPYTGKQSHGISYRVYPMPLPLPIQVSPSIATIDGYLVLASNPTVMESILSAKKKGNGLKSTAQFAKLMKGLPTKGNAFSYASPVFQEEMERFQKEVLNQPNDPGAKMIQELANVFQMESGYTIGIAGFEKDGFFSVGKSNVNQAKIFVIQMALVPVATTSIMAGMLLPVLSKAREKARRANCSGNLKQLGLALLGYSGDNKGNFPKDLATLIETNDMPPSKVYACPSSDNYVAPKDAADLRAGTCGYLYFGNGVRDDDPNFNKVIIACDKPTNHRKEWINVLFVDGHVEGCKASSIEEAARIKGWIIRGITDKK